MTEGEFFYAGRGTTRFESLFGAPQGKGTHISKYIVDLVRNRRPGLRWFDVDDDSGLVVK
jgi:hypothetical protein